MHAGSGTRVAEAYLPLRQCVEVLGAALAPAAVRSLLLECLNGVKCKARRPSTTQQRLLLKCMNGPPEQGPLRSTALGQLGERGVPAGCLSGSQEPQHARHAEAQYSIHLHFSAACQWMVWESCISKCW